MDEIERAQEYQMKFNADALRARGERYMSPPVTGPVICVDCNTEIDPRRISAEPAARRCIECQTDYDKIKERTYGY